jgi:hypothetical protein
MVVGKGAAEAANGGSQEEGKGCDLCLLRPLEVYCNSQDVVRPRYCGM